MSRVEIHLELIKPLNEELMERIAVAHSIYGIRRVRLAPTMDEIIVEYDASRLTPQEVEAALHRFGIPCRLKQPVAAG